MTNMLHRISCSAALSPVRACVTAGAAIFALAAFLATDAVAQEEAQAGMDAAVPGIVSLVAESEPPVFDTPQAALDAFRQAVSAEGGGKVADLLGLDAEKIGADEHTRATLDLIREGVARQVLLDGEGERRIVLIGHRLWPLPFPVVEVEDGKWAFDTYAGLQEIVNRRLGENELETIATLRAYVLAQEDYASRDRDGDGVKEFAQKLISSDGLTDGLYWPADAEKGESPAGDGIDRAELASAGGDGYFGYRYRILAGQGDNIAGGAYDYVINGNMIAGFGLIAWPALYGETGVHTFAVSHHGIVYEVDLGPATEAIVKHIERFNPDEDWNVVND